VPNDTIVVHGEEDEVVPLVMWLTWARPQELPIVVFRLRPFLPWPPCRSLQRAVAGQWQ
jgi:hypothetical protein